MATSDSFQAGSAPFPDGLPLIQLKRIPIRALFDGDKQTAKEIYETLCNEGFFYLDLNGDVQGEDFIRQSEVLREAAKDIFTNNPLSEKNTWKGDPLKGVLDKGYRAIGPDENGEPKIGEVLVVPSNELLNDPSYTLPAWLDKYKSSYQAFARHSVRIGQAIFANLEGELHLEPGELTSLHEPGVTTGGFVRMIRYPAPAKIDPQAPPVGPVHTDGNSLTLLFKWSGGFQIARPKASEHRAVRMIDGDHADADWLWVKPIRGCVLVNLGDPMPIFSNHLLASGRHRVVDAPGQQAGFDSYSILAGLRPRSETLMKPLKSDVIPPETAEQMREPARTALENAIGKVAAIYAKADAITQPTKSS